MALHTTIYMIQSSWQEDKCIARKWKRQIVYLYVLITEDDQCTLITVSFLTFFFFLFLTKLGQLDNANIISTENTKEAYVVKLK